MTLLQDQNYVSDQQPMPVQDMGIASFKKSITGETIQLYYPNAGTRTADAGIGVGTAVTAPFEHRNILSSDGTYLATRLDSSLSFVGTCFTTEVNFPKIEFKEFKNKSWADKLSTITANFNDGDYCVDYATGVIYGVKASTVTSLTSVAYTIRTSVTQLV